MGTNLDSVTDILIRFLFAMFTGIMETEVPESANHVSYLFVDLPSTLPIVLGDALSYSLLFFFRKIVVLPNSW